MEQHRLAALRRLPPKHIALGALLAAVLASCLIGGFSARAAAPETPAQEVWVIRVDGREVAAAGSEEELSRLYDRVLLSYQTEGIDSVEALNSVELAQADSPVGPEVPREEEAAAQALAEALTVRAIGVSTQTSELPYDTVYVEDDTLYVGESYTEEGCPGEQVAYLSTIYINGVELGTKLDHVEVVSQPQDTVVTVGALEKPLGLQVTEYATQFLGGPYVWGGTSLTGGCDCSGFVLAVYRSFGYSLPHSSAAMRGVGYAVSVEDIQPGDIVCYPGHVGIYAGSGQIINALNPSRGIVYTSLHYDTILSVRRIGG